MEIPIDIIIKEFRNSAKGRAHDHVFGYFEDFLDFLVKNFSPPKDVDQRQILRILDDAFKQIGQEISNEAFNMLVSDQKQSDLHPIFLKIIDDMADEYLLAPRAQGFEEVDVDQLMEKYNDAFEMAIERNLGPLPIDDEDKSKLRHLAGIVLCHDVFSEHYTGLVVAGFGESEIFPSLQAIEIDGIIDGRLKKKETWRIDIDRDGETADIIPFAQRDMVDRFLYGIDSEFEGAVKSFIEEVVVEAGDSVVDATVRRPKKKIEKLKDSVRIMGRDAADKFTDKTSNQIKEFFKKQIKDMVLMMPKQELATMATSLVELTSTKRRVSAEKETVGGPVDVAVISKSEGFVWVKRKHYFDPALNPRFFVRQFGAMQGIQRGRP